MFEFIKKLFKKERKKKIEYEKLIEKVEVTYTFPETIKQPIILLSDLSAAQRSIFQFG